MYGHGRHEPFPASTVVPLYIQILPISRVFEAGHYLLLRLSGHEMSLPEVEMLRLKEPVDENRGEHTVYTGGEYASYSVLLLIQLLSRICSYNGVSEMLPSL